MTEPLPVRWTGSTDPEITPPSNFHHTRDTTLSRPLGAAGIWPVREEAAEAANMALGAEALGRVQHADQHRSEVLTLRVEPGDPQRPANHGIPVESFAGESRCPPRDCAEYALPFLIECGYDAAGLLLRHLYPECFSSEPVDPHGAGSLHAFDQTEFFQPSRTAGLSGVGYIYVPDVCRSEECRLHLAFHGCRQNADARGDERVHDDFVRDAGYNRRAAANRIAVLYPQATEAAGNPRACWDFWGYSGVGWRTRDGIQMRAAGFMIERLLSR